MLANGAVAYYCLEANPGACEISPLGWVILILIIAGLLALVTLLGR